MSVRGCFIMQLSFTEANRRLWRKFFTIKDRASRSEYWQACLILHCIPFIILFIGFILLITAIFLVPAAQGRPPHFNASQSGGLLNGWLFLTAIAMIMAMVGMIPLTIRRLHDVSMNGFFLLLFFVPIVDLWLIYRLLCKSHPLNKYGPCPPEADDRTLKNSTLTIFKQFLQFSGRTSRSEFALGFLSLYWIFLFLQQAVFFLLDPSGLFAPDPASGDVVLRLSLKWSWELPLFASYPMIVALIFLLLIAPLTVRRLHDSGRSEWYVLLLFIPVVGNICLLYWTLQLSEGDNRFGPQPPETMLSGDFDNV